MWSNLAEHDLEILHFSFVTLSWEQQYNRQTSTLTNTQTGSYLIKKWRYFYYVLVPEWYGTNFKSPQQFGLRFKENENFSSAKFQLKIS